MRLRITVATCNAGDAHRERLSYVSVSYMHAGNILEAGIHQLSSQATVATAHVQYFAALAVFKKPGHEPQKPPVPRPCSTLNLLYTPLHNDAMKSVSNAGAAAARLLRRFGSIPEFKGR